MWHFINKIRWAVLLFVTVSAAAQNIDSLKIQLIKTADKRQKALLALAVGHQFDGQRNLDSSIVYYQQAISLAEPAGFDSVAMESNDKLGSNEGHLRKYDEAIMHIKRAIALADRLKLPSRKVDFMYHELGALMERGDFEAGFAKYQETLKLALELGNKRMEAKLYTAISRYYRSKSQIGTAIDYLSRSIQLSDSLKNYPDVAFGYSKIAVMHSIQYKMKNAIHYALIADSIYTRIGDEAGKYHNYMDLGSFYNQIGDYTNALNVVLKAQKFFANDPTQTMQIAAQLATIYTTTGNYKEAKKYFHISSYYNKITRHSDVAELDINNTLAMIFFEEKNLDSALYYATLTPWDNDLTKIERGRIQQFKDRLDILTKIYTAQGDKKNGIFYFEKYKICRDSIDQQINQDYRAEAETRLNMAEKDRAIKMLATENELQKTKEQKNRLATIFLISLLLLGGAVIVVVIVFYRRVVKQNKDLADKKRILGEQKDQIDAQNIRLSEDMKMKSKFMANVSHELRTPVTLISGVLELMRDEKEANKEQNEIRLGVAYNNSRKLQRMVEEILDLTRIENSVIKNNPKALEVSQLLGRITLAFESFVKKGNQSLIFENKIPAGTWLKADEDNFEKILNNLIYNAFKFNKEGGYIKVESRLSENNDILIIVSDSGRGIQPADLPHIFERFYKASETGNESGIGIGLSLVKELIGIMGGAINVCSNPGEGTVFTLSFPQIVDFIAEKTAETELQPETENWEYFKQKQTILIIEDNTDMRYYLNEVFGGLVNVAQSANGKDALKWLETNKPDLIITDLMMPEMDGREFVSRLKSDDKYSGTPVIMLTAIADSESQLSMLRMGIDDYIVKPFNKDELRVRAYNLLRNNSERNQFNQEPAEQEDIIVTSKEADEFRAKITDYVLQRLKKTNVSVYDLANEMAINERQLYRLAKSLTGCTPAQLIKEVRLQKAYELLSSGKIYKIDDVSRQVGFETSAYFAKQFFERFGKKVSDFF